MDKELRDLIGELKRERKLNHYQYHVEQAGRDQAKKVDDLEVKIIKKLFNLIRKRIKIRKQGIGERILQKKFPRIDERKKFRKETYATMYISTVAQPRYHALDSPSPSYEFDMDDRDFTAAIKKRHVIYLLKEILISIS